MFESLVERGGRLPLYVWSLGTSYARAGRTQEARALLDPIHGSNFPAIYRAMSHFSLGETDQAFAALEQAVAQRADWMYSLGHQPFLAELRTHPRFQTILASMHLPRDL